MTEPTLQSIGLSRSAGLLLVAGILAGGQVLFKLASAQLVIGNGTGPLLRSFVSAPMVAALVLYAAATLLWVYLLHGVPLSRAYPFMALAFAFVPLLSWIVFGDALDLRYAFGVTLILCGLYLAVTVR